MNRSAASCFRLLSFALAVFVLTASAFGEDAGAGFVVPLAEREFGPVAPTLVIGDSVNFFALGGGGMSRVTRAGLLLDRNPLVLRNAPTAAAAGAGVVVTLSPDRSGITYALAAWTPSGDPLWSHNGQVRGDLFFDGTMFEHVWVNGSEGVFVTRFDASGAIVLTRRIAASKAGSLKSARSSRGYVLTWITAEGTLAQFVDHDGFATPLRKLTPIATSAMYVATSGEDAVVAFTTGQQLNAVRFDRERLIGGPAPVAYDVARDTGNVVWDGQVYRMMWVSSTDTVHVRDLATGLATASRAEFHWKGRAPHPCPNTRAAAVAGRVLLTACGMGVIVDAGQPIASAEDAKPVYTEARSIDHAAVAWTGDRYIVVWSSGSPAAPWLHDLDGRFFAIDGTPLGETFAIASKVTRASQVAATGDGVLVAWDGDSYEGTPARARRFDLSGVPVDSQPFDIPGDLEPAIASNGTEFVIVTRASSCVFELRHLGSRGTHYSLLERPFATLEQCKRGEWWYDAVPLALSQVVWDGEAYAILFNESRPTGMEWIIETPYLARVTRDGSVTGPVQIEEEGFGAYAVAAGDGRYLVFAAGRPILISRDLQSVRPLSGWPGWQDNPRPLWTGSSWMLFAFWGFSKFSPVGQEIESGSFYEPAGCFEPVRPVPIQFAGAGNGCGGALLPFTYRPDPEISLPDTGLFGRVFPCSYPKQRSARK